MAQVVLQVTGALEAGHVQYRDEHYGAPGEGDASGLFQVPDYVMIMQTAAVVRDEANFEEGMSDETLS